MSSVLVVVPTYNEIATLEAAVTRVRSSYADVDVLVVDDGSPDGTGELADRLAADDDQVHVLHRTRKLGLGAAYVAGFEWGLARGYDVLVEMDADGSHRPEDLSRLLEAIDDADLVIGSRYVPGGAVVNWPKRRELLSRVGNRYVRLALGAPLHDATGGFRAFRAETLRKLVLSDVASHGYCFQVDLAWRTLRAGLNVVEVPITFVERERGESKMDGTIVREALWKVTAWGAAHRMRQVRALAARNGVGDRRGPV